MGIYEIPVLLAIRLMAEPELSEGSTQPLLIECANISALDQPIPYVVKFPSRMNSDLGVLKEIVAGLLALHFNISIPNFVRVEITDAFCEAAYRNMQTSSIVLTTINQNIHSNNFGSEYISENPLTLPFFESRSNNNNEEMTIFFV